MSDIVLTCAGCGAHNRVRVERLAQSPSCGKCEAPLADPRRPLELDDTTFPEVIAGSTRPVLVDFWAPWCGPCRHFGPTLETYASEHGDSVLVAKVNVDSARRAAARVQASSIPLIVLFSQGKEVARHVGVMSMRELLQFVSVAA